MLDKTDDISVAADNWLAQFEDALAKSDDGALKTLFHPDSYWRDVLALSWNIQTINGADAILKRVEASRPPAPRRAALRSIPTARAPRKVMRAGTNAIEAIFKFETSGRPRQRHHPADPGCRRRQHAEGLDAADRARRTQGF